MRLSTLAFTASLAFIAVTVVCGYVDGGSLGSDSYHHRRAEWKSQPAVQPHIIHAVNRDNSSTWTAGTWAGEGKLGERDDGVERDSYELVRAQDHCEQSISYELHTGVQLFLHSPVALPSSLPLSPPSQV